MTGAPLKSWDRFEMATVSPGFTPSTISTAPPWRAPGLTARSSTLPPATTNTLVMPTKEIIASAGTKLVPA